MILLDTCTLLWLAADQTNLSSRARRLIERHAGQLFVSAMTAFEISIKHRKGHLELPMDPAGYYSRALELHGIREIPVDGAIAARSVALPLIHRDPVDRMIVATAQLRDQTLLTPDSTIRTYPDTQVAW